MMDKETLPPHVLIFPLPFQGPVNCTIKLAEVLCLSGLHITLLVTDHIHAQLLKYSNIQSRFNCYPGFHLESISDGLPEDHPRFVDTIMELFESLKTKSNTLFKDILTSGKLSSDSRRPVTCIIADGFMGYTCDVANEIGIPIIYIRTISACCLWVFFCLPKLIDSGELPFAGNDLDAPIKGIPGMEDFLRRRDLPMFCRFDMADPKVKLYLDEGTENPRAHGLILNTFDDLEGPIVSKIRTFCPNLYAIGPLHAHLKLRLESFSSLPSSNSLWKEDISCIPWLDSQPPKSVLYVSFGSLAVMKKEQYIELWHGLVNSGCPFLWVVRSNSVLNGSIEIQPELSKVNSRFVGEVWKLGLDMKDTCDKVIVEKMVRELMEDRRDEFRKSADQMARLAKQCLMKGGLSYCNLERLIKDIKAM
ncbi:hypothetical protein L2E82_32160 [Cichorium intybus]|uniref:Uncharacterized protein n=1 Tax=Cichorium intybus TaxID=13427 RepID=A0ACB9BGR4_CICIN|nr:hypothetical protein L2E82_32160 [Cichorium intybus]